MDPWLKEKKAKTLLLMGIHSCACVLSTAKSAINLGYDIVTSHDLVTRCNLSSCVGGEHDWYAKNGVYVMNHSTLL